MQPPARFDVGSVRCLLIQDGQELVPPEQLFINAPPEQLEPLLRGRLDGQGMLAVPTHCLLIDSGGRLALVDTGIGDYAAALGATSGGLQPALRATGVDAKDVEVVIITHAHPDHSGGLVSAGQPAFPRARHLISAAEWPSWNSPEILGRVPDFVAAAMPTIVEAQLRPLERAGLLQTIDDREEAIPGVTIVPAPGHTPGHLVVEIAAAGQRALYLADAIVHEAQFAHPDWSAIFDLDAEATAAKRRELLDRAAAEQALVLATHLPAGGRVERANDAYRFHAVQPVSPATSPASSPRRR